MQSISVVREALFKDGNKIFNCGKEGLPLYYNIAQVMFHIMSNDSLVLVAESNDTNKDIMGFVIATKNQTNNSNCHITSFAVDKKFRRSGIGTKLIKSLETLCKKDKLDNLTLYVHDENKGAITFYESFGFSKSSIKKDYYEGSLDTKSTDALLMKKDI